MNLERQGFRTFVPRRKKTVRHARKLSIRHVAYFPGYIFTAFDLQRDRWRSINGTVGIRHLLMNGEKPVPAPTTFVEGLIRSADKAGLIILHPELAPGMKVRATNGPFADLIGTLHRHDGEARVRVLFEIMNGKIPVSMDRENVIEAA